MTVKHLPNTFHSHPFLMSSPHKPPPVQMSFRQHKIVCMCKLEYAGIWNQSWDWWHKNWFVSASVSSHCVLWFLMNIYPLYLLSRQVQAPLNCQFLIIESGNYSIRFAHCTEAWSRVVFPICTLTKDYSKWRIRKLSALFVAALKKKKRLTWMIN